MKKFSFNDLILHEDDDYVIINKPPFVSSLEDRNDPVNILSLARGYCESASVCHRLDKETSGVMVIAKNAESYRALSLQFENRSVAKTYHALCDGVCDFNDVSVNQPLFVTGKGYVKIDPYHGKEALTRLNTLKAYKLHSLVACEPLTGRMHQIRIHLASLKAPISGDEKYGGKPFFLSEIKRKFNLKKGTEELPLIKRIALHAFKIKFIDRKSKELEIEAPYPKDFRVLIKQLELNK